MLVAEFDSKEVGGGMEWKWNETARGRSAAEPGLSRDGFLQTLEKVDPRVISQVSSD